MFGMAKVHHWPDLVGLADPHDLVDPEVGEGGSVKRSGHISFFHERGKLVREPRRRGGVVYTFGVVGEKGAFHYVVNNSGSSPGIVKSF